MKNILIILVIVVLIYKFNKPDVIPMLMNTAHSAQVNSSSGIQDKSSVGGPGFNVSELSVYGQVTVVDFYVSKCPACKQLTKNHQRLLKVRPDLAIRRVRMKDKWTSQWAQERYDLDIKSTPHVIIFDAQGEVIIQDDGNYKGGYKYLFKWLNEELNRAYNHS